MKRIYLFEEGNKEMKNLLGGKGANLAEMASLGVPVPPGFTITTEVCNEYTANGMPVELKEDLINHVQIIEEKLGKKFGSPENPLLFSVRSGARVSMPGMMDTVLNLGLNDETVQSFEDERFAYDSYRRFLQMFGDVVLGVKHEVFMQALDKKKELNNVQYDKDLSVEALKELVQEYKDLIKENTGKDFPTNPKEQLILSVKAVFDSWNNNRAKAYRKMNRIPDEWGTAVTVQSMVFGNLSDSSGTGVAFSRDPSTGKNELYGEYLMNAQGEDVVAGIRTPVPISELEKENPEVFKQFTGVVDKLENHYKDMQDMEFTIENGKLFFLQTRNGKRTATAAVKIAVDMVNEGLIDKKTALLRVEPDQLNQLLHPTIDPNNSVESVAKGLPASPGAATGKIVFSAQQAMEQNELGERVVLVRLETSPEDLEGMNVAKGILTARGGMTSHAAVVARGMGKCCVSGCNEINVNEKEKTLTIKDKVLSEGDVITLNGSTGQVFLGALKLVEPKLEGEFGRLMEWADEVRVLKVRTNADTPKDSIRAREFGAEGIGLCRTEHMFFEADRIKAVREMILSETLDGRKKALDKILPMQRGDFKELFKVMKGLPVTIRLLDPPLHEFLPKEDRDIKDLSEQMSVSEEKLRQKIDDLHEVNPMLGHRGCRLGLTFPEIYDMQVRAIIEAACELKKEGQEVIPEIMIPLVGHVNELKESKKNALSTAKKVMEEQGIELKYLIGTMIEIPRAALTADAIAEEAEFFSFGTNDLTQMGFGISRDDGGKFIPYYIDKKLYARDPFQSLDQEGIGQLVQIASDKGRSKREGLKLGICGEHGGDPKSIDFCHRVGLNYVSCSPFRVPIARLAAAQAAINN